MSTNLSYSDYLQLNKILTSQQSQSALNNNPIHDETLFIITHQTYELWFKQILHELTSIMSLLSKDRLDERDLTLIVSRGERMTKIQQLLVDQVTILETMTPMDFLDFRGYLGTSSGFQSKQFRELECRLGRNDLISSGVIRQLSEEEQQEIIALSKQPSLIDLVNRWLEHMPFLQYGSFDFWTLYADATKKMIDEERDLLNNNLLDTKEKQTKLTMLTNTESAFQSFLNKGDFTAANAQWHFRFSQKALLSTLFIFLYREEPILYLPFRFLNQLMDIDECLTMWRQRHVVMVQRMLGSKMGTGGSSGSQYLQSTVDRGRIYSDLCNIANFIIPRGALPKLPAEMKKALDFSFTYQDN